MNRAHHFALPMTVLLATLALGACKREQQPAAAASSAPQSKPGVTITGARLVLPAVTGNPGAAYFVLDNQSKGTVAVGSVAIDGVGKTELHTNDMKTVDHAEAEARTILKFEPGQVHVMAFDVSTDLKAGAETELTVVFTDGDKVSVPARIEAMGAGAMAPMGTSSEAPRP